MEVVAKLKYLRIAPRKVRLVADLIRGKRIDKAQEILKFKNKKSTLPLLKLLNQAIANAKNNLQLETDNLYISKITVDEGPKYKRWRARAHGRVGEIQKKTSHITLVLGGVLKEEKKKKKKTEAQKKEKPKEVKEEKTEGEILEWEKQKKEKIKIRPEKELKKPKADKGLRRFFRRKSF